MSRLISRTKLYVDVADRIQDRIRSGYWKTGERIPSEVELAEAFEVSRSTVREAVQSLKKTGILYAKPGAGTYVAEEAPAILMRRELSAMMGGQKHLRDLVQARLILEPQLAALAAKHATKEECQHLLQLVDRMQTQSERFHLMTMGYAFHMELAAMAHNSVLESFYQSAAGQLHTMRGMESLTLEVYLQGVEEHRRIAEAIANADADAAMLTMQEHLKKDYAEFLMDN